MSGPRSLGPIVQSFFLDHLVAVKGLRPSSVRSYRDTIRLLLCFVADDKKTKITRLGVEDLSCERILRFLRHLEDTRGNQVRTRNQRLAAVHTLFDCSCSGGGVLSSWAIGHTNRFAAAAVRCPVTNWMSMFGQTDIPFFTQSFFHRPFWEDPTEWPRQSPIMYVGNVTTPTLLMTGELDLRTPMPQTEEYFAALKYRGVPTRMLRFQSEYHGTGTRPSNAIRTILYMADWYGQWERRGEEARKR